MVARRRFEVILLAAVLAGAILLWTTDGAEARTFGTSSSFGFYSGTPGSDYPSSFHGQISSPSSQCRKARQVKVFRKQRRRDVLVGKARASSTGQWTVEVNRRVPLAKYFALVPRKKFGPRGRNVCRGYKSSALTFGQS